jgi:large subunit ribosomal protein L19
MTTAIVQAIQKSYASKEMPDIKTGMEVEVHQIIKEAEGKERIQKFRGLVIRTAGKNALGHVITVRRDVDGVGIEKVFPLQSPSVAKIEIIHAFKVRRKNIGFIRGLTGKAARLKEIK